MTFLTHVWYILTSPLDFGWETRKTWPTKSYFGIYHIYYDVNLASIHIGPFYCSVCY